MHVLVLAGGLSAERDVSLRSGRRVAEALRLERPDWEVQRARRRRGPARPPSHATARTASCPCCTARPARTARCAMCWRHCGCRSSARAPRRAGWPSTSRSPSGSSRTPASRTPECVAMPQSTFRELGAAAVLDAVVERLGLPLMVKPTKGGSSLGHRRSSTRAADLPAAMVGAFAYGDVALIEQFVAGTRSRSASSSATATCSRCRRSRSSPTASSTTTPRATPPAPPSSSARRGSPTSRPIAAQAVALNVHVLLGLRDWSRTRPDRRRRRVAVVPRGQRRARHDRDVAVPAGAGGRRGRPRHRHRRARRDGRRPLLTRSVPRLSDVDDPAQVLEVRALDHQAAARRARGEAIRRSPGCRARRPRRRSSSVTASAICGRAAATRASAATTCACGRRRRPR